MMKKIFLVLVLALVCYELVALTDQQSGDTISEIFWDLTTHHAIVPFAFGFLCGHFFWQKDGS